MNKDERIQFVPSIQDNSLILAHSLSARMRLMFFLMMLQAAVMNKTHTTQDANAR